MKNSSRGFTLIEILMVILIVGIIAGVAIPSFIDFGSEARTEVTLNRLAEIKTAITGDPKLISNGQYTKPGFENHLGALPNSLDDLVNQGTYPDYDPITKTGWRGPYVNSTIPFWQQDAWGTQIQYSQAERNLRSCGADRTCGNADDLIVSF